VDIVRSAAWLAGTAAGYSVHLAAVGARAVFSAAEQVIETADRAAGTVRDAASAVSAQIAEDTAEERLTAEDNGDIADQARQVATTAAAELTDAGPVRSRRSVWRRAGRAHIEIRGMAGNTGRDIATGVTSALRYVKGVRWAQVNAVTQQVLVAFDEDQTSLETVLNVIRAVEEENGADDDGFRRSKPEIPGDRSAENAAVAELAASLAGTGLAVVGRMMRVPGLPRAVRLPAVLAQSNPRVRAAIETRLGQRPSSLIFGLVNAITHVSTVDPYPLAVESAQRALALVEARSRRLVWERRSEELFGCVPTADAARPSRPVPLPPGPVEKAGNLLSFGGLAGAAGVLAATHEPGRAADLLLASAPKAARMGREAFASRWPPI
jgi:cation-transporting P-type ATPase I